MTAMETKKDRIDLSKKPGSLPYIWKRISRNSGAMIGLALLCAIIVLCLLSPVIMKYDYAAVDMRNRFATPSGEHWFGCDELGRDIMSRIFYGARYTLSIGVGAVLIASISGIFIGAIAGYFGGTLDAVLMRVLDVLQSFPGLVSAIAVATVLGTGLGNSILAIGISFMPPFARLMRANILQIRGSEYIEAATIMRCSTGRIIMRHLGPNAISPIIVQISMSIAQAALTASTLSFLGLGVKEPTPEWGSVFFRGKPASGAPGEGLRVAAVGAGTTVGELTVWENLLVLRPRSAPLRVLNARRMRRRCALLLYEYGLAADPDAVFRALPPIRRFSLELLRARLSGAEIAFALSPLPAGTAAELDALRTLLHRLAGGGAERGPRRPPRRAFERARGPRRVFLRRRRGDQGLARRRGGGARARRPSRRHHRARLPCARVVSDRPDLLGALRSRRGAGQPRCGGVGRACAPREVELLLREWAVLRRRRHRALRQRGHRHRRGGREAHAEQPCRHRADPDAAFPRAGPPRARARGAARRRRVAAGALDRVARTGLVVDLYAPDALFPRAPRRGGAGRGALGALFWKKGETKHRWRREKNC